MEMLPSYAPSLLAGRTSCCGGGQDDKTARMNNLKGNQSGAMVSLFTRAVQWIGARGYLLFGRRGGCLRRLLIQIAINVERTDGRVKFGLRASAFVRDALSFF